MNLIKNIFTSSLGKKYIMALTGLGMFVFVVLHLIGNLQIFLGAEILNRYGAFLQSNVELLWPARIGLLVLLGLHIWSAVKLTAENRRARAVRYEMNKNTGSSYASRTMMMSGIIIAVFIVYHILHFTVQVESVNLTGQNFVDMKDAQNRHDVYRMMVVGFSNVWVSGFYILGMALLCLHLSHGLSAMFQSIGLKDGAYSRPINIFAKAAALAIFVGYVSIPAAVLGGLVKEAPESMLADNFTNGDWSYQGEIEFAGTRSERRSGRLFHKGEAVPGMAGKTLDTPLGKFMYFGEAGYNTGWLRTMTYNRRVFDDQGTVTKDAENSIPASNHHVLSTLPSNR